MNARSQPQQAATKGAHWLQRLKQRVAPPPGQEMQPAAKAPAPTPAATATPVIAITEAQQLHAGRTARFTERGLNPDEACRLADTLAKRDDSEYADMVVCLECRYCQRGKYCTMWQAAGIGRELGGIATMLQRCPAYRPDMQTSARAAEHAKR